MKTNQKRAIWYSMRDKKTKEQKQYIKDNNLQDDFYIYMENKDHRRINLFRTLFIKKHRGVKKNETSNY